MWRDLYQFGANRTTYTRPNVMSITPGKALALGPVPTSGYTIVGEYYAIPTELTLLTDIPRLPSQYHMAIVYRAMMFYGAFEAASEVFSLGQSEFNKMINRLESQYLPEIEVAGSDV